MSTRRNNDAQSRPSDQESMFTNPVGSVGSQSVYRDAVATTEMYSKYDHQGVFSTNNPYYIQFKATEDKQDAAAIYELAIQWEADYANRQMQLEENRAILEEQREYDSPEAQMRRMRAAGINPDLEGAGSAGSAGGSSAQLTNPGMADQTGQTKFSNPYDTAHLVFEGINTAASFTSALAGGVSGIMTAISNMKMVPSEIALNEANASLSSAKADEINKLLAGKKKSLDLSNVAQGISNTSATLQQLAQFSELIAPDTVDMAPHLKALGVEEAQIAPYTDLIKQMHANPQLRDKYAKAELSARWSEEQNAQYTDAVVAAMTELQRNIDYEQKHWNFQTTQLQGKIAQLLNTNSFAEQTASNEVTAELLEGQALGVKSDELQLYAKQLTYDTEAFLKSIADRAVTIQSIDETLANLHKQPKTPQRDAQINRLNAERIGLRTMLSNEFYKVKDTYLSTSQQIYNNQTLLNKKGKIVAEGRRSAPNFFSDVTFNDLIHHQRTPGEIAQGWVNTTIDAAEVVVDALGVMRGFQFNTVYKDAHNGAQYKKGYRDGSAQQPNFDFSF